MKFLKYLIFLLLILVIGFAIYIAVQPNEFDVARTRNIQAPAEVVFNNVNDFKNWPAWSAWLEKNPETKLSFPEKTSGVDGYYTWEDEDGIGKMTTTGVNAPTTIEQEMQFGDFPPSKVSWDFNSGEKGSTDITWRMQGDDLPFIMKFFGAISGGFENMLGPDFERGLEKLDSIVVASMKKYAIVINGVTQHGGGYYLYNTTSCKISDYQAKMEEMFPKVSAYTAEKNIRLAGPAFQLVHKYDEENNAIIFSCAVPTSERIVTDNPDILTGRLQPFKALKSTLKGDYSNLSEAWQTTMKHIEDNGIKFIESGPMMESYLTEPRTTPNPADWVTEIFIAIE
ncbi:MAG: SRPBCC family protein [Bacteroidia bacterium]|nr:SRPBCC family protein [Bacteroidia bacterium]MBT8310854.1 SRPBCC family protein [Bacteroidia bacterium]NNK28915.1 transcription activator effector-binding protein [Flavobacteriaceae bacterium]NNL60487.1 transcription activator effector-binding protein [Flavobacteriaceae bacterium]